MAFFQKINSAVPLSKQKQIVETVIQGDPKSSHIYILTSDYERSYLPYLNKVFSKIFEGESYCILYCYRFRPQGNDDKAIGDFVRKNTIDLAKFINPFSKVITLGRALYSITKETELMPEAFYAYNYVKTHFFAPEIKSWVFPVDTPEKFISLGGKRFLDSFCFHFFKHQVVECKNFTATPLRIPELKVELLENPNEWLKQFIGKKMEVAWDLETDGLLYYRCGVICLTMSFDGQTGYYLPWEKIDPAVLSDFFEDKFQIGANLKFDIKFLRLNGVENVKIDFDTFSAGHVLNEMRSNSLGTHGWLYTYYGGHEVELTKYKDDHAIKSFRQIPRSILSKYAAMDAIITFQVYKAQLKELEADKERRKGKVNLYDYYFNEMVPNLNLFSKIEMNGINVDWERMNKMADSYVKKREELANKIYEEVGHPFNLESPRVLGTIIEQELGWEFLGERSKTGEYLTGEDSLNAWEKKGHSLATLLKQYKAISTFLKTFIGERGSENGWRRFRDKEGYLHPTYVVMGAESGRQKCYDPNWQQAPKQGEGAKEFRLTFQPPKDSRNFIYSTRSVSLTLEDGSTLEFSRYEKLKVNRNGEEIVVQARDLQEGDDFIKVV